MWSQRKRRDTGCCHWGTKRRVDRPGDDVVAPRADLNSYDNEDAVRPSRGRVPRDRGSSRRSPSSRETSQPDMLLDPLSLYSCVSASQTCTLPHVGELRRTIHRLDNDFFSFPWARVNGTGRERVAVQMRRSLSLEDGSCVLVSVGHFDCPVRCSPSFHCRRKSSNVFDRGVRSVGG